MFSQIYYVLGRKSIDIKNTVQSIYQQVVPKPSENKASFFPYLLISLTYLHTSLLDSLETEVLATKKGNGVFLGTPQLFSYWY